jgi:hypothetical protein
VEDKERIDTTMERLTDYLRASGVDRLELRISEIESIVGSPLPESAKNWRAFWNNSEHNNFSRFWLTAGYRVTTRTASPGVVGFVRERGHAFLSPPSRPSTLLDPSSGTPRRERRSEPPSREQYRDYQQTAGGLPQRRPPETRQRRPPELPQRQPPQQAPDEPERPRPDSAPDYLTGQPARPRALPPGELPDPLGRPEQPAGLPPPDPPQLTQRRPDIPAEPRREFEPADLRGEPQPEPLVSRAGDRSAERPSGRRNDHAPAVREQPPDLDRETLYNQLARTQQGYVDQPAPPAPPAPPARPAPPAPTRDDRGQHVADEDDDDEPAPLDAAELREVETSMIAELGTRLGMQLSPRSFVLPEGGRLVIDAASGDAQFLCEAWAYQGPPRAAQRHEVLAEAFKLHFLAQVLGGDRRLALLFGDAQAAAPFRGSKWFAQALRLMGIEIHVVDLPEELRRRVITTQER